MTSADLRRMADEAEALEGERSLAEVCRIVGVGVRAIQSRDRTSDTARRRSVVTWILCERLNWTQARAAKAICRSVIQVKRMVAREKE